MGEWITEAWIPKNSGILFILQILSENFLLHLNLSEPKRHLDGVLFHPKIVEDQTT
jgi:hypothetical protein